MNETLDFHGPHAASRQPAAEPVTWHEVVPRFERVRVVLHTCECRTRIYELCASGGLSWVRRTDRLEPGPVVKETYPRPVGEAEELWLKILTGQAR